MYGRKRKSWLENTQTGQYSPVEYYSSVFDLLCKDFHLPDFMLIVHFINIVCLHCFNFI